MGDTYMVKMRKVFHICVNCVENDRVDIRCGGPHWLGFDFYVSKRYIKTYLEHIKECLQKYRIPLRSMHHIETEVHADHKLWTKERIAKAIAEERYLHGKAW